MAAAIVPMLGMIGGGIDMGRAYLVQARLQQACDAGVLAARKTMGSQVIATGEIPDNVLGTGNRFFNANFRDGIYGSVDRDFAMAVEDDYSLTAHARVGVPASVMQLFGFGEIPIAVDCAAKLNFSNTDVMMVLDTTGSMAQTMAGDTKTKIQGLRDVVTSFYTQLEGAKKPGTRIRYGFVPYSANVNVGGLLQSGWVVDNWTYQGRVAQGSHWDYKPTMLDVRFLKGASDDLPLVGGSINVPMNGTSASPSNLTASFRGCMEERATYEIDDYDNVDLNRAKDLDLDTVPDPADPDTQWRPMLHEISFERSLDWWGNGTFTPAEVKTATNFISAQAAGTSACPTSARKLAEISSGDLTSYLNSLQARGSTYHDIGMIWGGRLLSPTGLFAAENADVSGKPTNRNLIFLTDGQTEPRDIVYGTYGIEPLDQRRWSPSSSLSLTQVVENRFAFACEEVKKKNVTVWLIAFGTALNPVMTKCAGDGHSFTASKSSELDAVFAAIARAMADLRVSG